MTNPISAPAPTLAPHMRNPHHAPRVSHEGTMKVFVNPHTADVRQASKAPGPGYVEASALEPAELKRLVLEIEDKPDRADDLRRLKALLPGS